jgi:hypothetical protein
MEQTYSSEADSRPGDQEIPYFMKLEDSLSCSQAPTLDPILGHMNPAHTLLAYDRP